MRELMILSGSAFLLALVLTPLCRNLFRRLGLVDRPDRDRKLHEQPIPHMGGVPILLAYLASFALISHFARPGTVNVAFLIRIAPAAAIIFAVGLLDDWLGLSPLQKLAAQFIAAGAAYMAGVQITGVAGYTLSPWLSVPVTVVWLLACANAFNLIDGVDGLAAGVGLFATATTLIAALMQHNLVLAIATAPLAGALAGFLRYNFNPATIFLGDSGSLLVGFLLGCFGVAWSQKSATILGMTAPLMALSVPILDVCLSVMRRFLRRQPIMGGDRGHIHHRLLDRGLSPRRVVLLLYGLAGVGAVFSIFQSVAVNHFAGAVILVFCAVAWMGVQNLGYTEFDQARRMILAGGFRHALNSQLTMREFDQALGKAQTPDQRWIVLQDAFRRFGLVEIHWFVDGKMYHDAEWESIDQECWSLRVPLTGDDYFNFTRPANLDDTTLNVSALVKIFRNRLARKFVDLEESSIKKSASSSGVREAELSPEFNTPNRAA